MSLLDLANKLDESGFDPKEGKEASGNEPIPAGTYLVNFEGITHNAKGDRDFLMLTFTIMQGEQEGRKESIFPTLAQTTSTGKPMPDFVISRAISLIKVVGAMCNIVVPNDVFAFDTETEAYEAIVPVLQPGIGTLMELTITDTPNKKNPDRPYRSYSFKPHAQPTTPKADDTATADNADPFKDAKTGAELTNDDLPFPVDDLKGDK